MWFESDVAHHLQSLLARPDRLFALPQQRLIHDVFVNSFVNAMRPTLLVLAAVLLLGALTCMLIARTAQRLAAPPPNCSANHKRRTKLSSQNCGTATASSSSLRWPWEAADPSALAPTHTLCANDMA